MNNPADDTPDLPQARLCQLAEVDRGKHGRWQKGDLLPKRRTYGLLDLLQAAQLDELSSTLGPKAGAAVWRQIRERVGVPGKRLEAVVELATLAANLVRSDAELDAALPRGQKVVVIDLGSRCARARERYRQFLTSGKHRPISAGPGAEVRNAL